MRRLKVMTDPRLHLKTAGPQLWSTGAADFDSCIMNNVNVDPSAL